MFVEDIHIHMDCRDPVLPIYIITACLPGTIAKGMLFYPQYGQMKGKLVIRDKDMYVR